MPSLPKSPASPFPDLDQLLLVLLHPVGTIIKGLDTIAFHLLVGTKSLLMIPGRFLVASLLQPVHHTVGEFKKVWSERHDRFERHARDIEGDLNEAAVPEEERYVLRSAKWTGPNVPFFAPTGDAFHTKLTVAAGPSARGVILMQFVIAYDAHLDGGL
jgi:hypothetical protein